MGTLTAILIGISFSDSVVRCACKSASNILRGHHPDVSGAYSTCKISYDMLRYYSVDCTRRTRFRRASRIPGTRRTRLYTRHAPPNRLCQFTHQNLLSQRPKPSYQRYLQTTANSPMSGTNTYFTTSPKAGSSTSSWQTTLPDGKHPPNQHTTWMHLIGAEYSKTPFAFLVDLQRRVRLLLRPLSPLPNPDPDLNPHSSPNSPPRPRPC